MSNIELYDALRVHMPEEAARLIADRLPHTEELATKSDLNELRSAFEQHRVATEAQIQALRADIRGWMLTFFVPLWIGVYGTLAAVVVSLILRG